MKSLKVEKVKEVPVNESLKKTILVVDDEPDMRLAIRNVLKIRGYNVIESGDGNTAVELATRNTPDLVLLDIRLPGMDGIEVLERIRRTNKTIPIVMITGYGHIQSAVDVMKLGAQEYMQKPFENAQLIETVKRFTEGTSQVKRTEIKSGAADMATYSSRESGAPKGGVKKISIYVLLLVAAAMGALLFKANLDKKNYRKIYPTGLENVSGMSITGDNVFVGDWVKQKINTYRLKDGELKLVKTADLKDSHITSFSVVGDKLYLADSWKQAIEYRSTQGNMPLIKVYNVPFKMTGISFDGKDIWLLDADGNLSSFRAGEELVPISSFKVEKGDEIFLEGKFLWELSGSERRIYKYSLGGAPKLEASYTLSDYARPISAFAVSGDRFYYIAGGNGEFVEINKAGLKKTR